MTTIKDVAKLAEVSVSTVSIVINGHGKERKIPDTTIQKVMNAVNELNYRPNINARRLRSTKSNLLFALYWPLDSRTNMLATLLSGFQQIIDNKKLHCELIVKTYNTDHIQYSFQDVLNNTYDGVIIGGCTQLDLDYLETIKTNTPVLLLNRSSKAHTTVSVEVEEIVQALLKIIDPQKSLHIIASNQPFFMANQRTSAFIESCTQSGYSISKIHHTQNSFEGGIEIAKEIGSQKNIQIYCEDDRIALGMLYQFNRMHVQIPKDISIFSLNYTDEHYTKYSTPALTTVDIPSKEIVSKAVDYIYQASLNNKKQISHICIKPVLCLRESTYSDQ